MCGSTERSRVFVGEHIFLQGIVMAETDFQQLDVDQFINEVRKYPEIWNVAVGDYHDRSKKRNAWMNICRVFFEDFDKEDGWDKSEMCSKLIKKWRNIKDNYMKSMKRRRTGQGYDSGRQYVYSKQLSFLQQPGAEMENQEGEEREELENQEEPEEQKRCEEVRTQYFRPLWYQLHSRRRVCDAAGNWSDCGDAGSTVHSIAVEEVNADRYFFESVLPSLSGFNDEQRLEFRSEVINLIRRMRAPKAATTQLKTDP